MYKRQAVQGTSARSQGAARSSSLRGLADWREDASRATGLALVPRTRKGFQVVSIEFEDLRSSVGLVLMWPAPTEHILQFMVSLYRKGLAPGTIRGRLSALAFYSKVNGIKDYSKDFRIRKMLEGWSKERGRVGDTRVPISPLVLEHICSQWALLCRDEYEMALFKAASLTAFLGALRISEFMTGGQVR